MDLDEYCPELLDDISELPDGGDDEECEGERRDRESLLTIRLREAYGASLKASADEVIHHPVIRPRVRTRRDAELAILGLDPDTLHPRCDWCEREERHGLRPEARGRWYMHVDCYVDAKEWRDEQGIPLLSLLLPPREWRWLPNSPSPACEIRSKPRPAALTEEQIAQVVTLRQWRFGQAEIAEKLGVNQASVNRALRKADEKGVRPKKLRGELHTIDWFGGEAAA